MIAVMTMKTIILALITIIMTMRTINMTKMTITTLIRMILLQLAFTQTLTSVLWNQIQS